MAQRRMFSKSIVNSDAFLDMPLSAQALYFHLNIAADDDGIISNAKRVQRNIGAADKDLKLLLNKRFLLTFDSGIYVIKHWRLHNYIRKDRYVPTLYQEEFKELYIKPNGAYTDHPLNGEPDGDEGDANKPPERQPDDIPDDTPDDTQASTGKRTKGGRQGDVGKDRLGKDSITVGVSARARTREECLGMVMTAYMDRISAAPPGAFVIERLTELSDKMEPEVITRVFEYAVAEQKYQWSYINGIFKQIEKDGVKTLEDLARREAARREQRRDASNGRNSSGVSAAPKREWNLPGGVDL